MRGKGACPAGVRGGGVRTSCLEGEAAQRQTGGGRGGEGVGGTRGGRQGLDPGRKVLLTTCCLLGTEDPENI